MNDATIQLIAKAVIANTEVLKELIAALPHEAKQAVAEVVNVAAQPAPVQPPAPAPVVIPEVVKAVAANAMPAPPAFPTVAATPPVPAPAPVVAAAPAPVVACPFSDHNGMIQYVMTKYKELGPQKGQNIQQVLTAMGCNTINELKPESYGQFYTQVEAIK